MPIKDKEKLSKYQKKYYQTNKEKIKKKNREYKARRKK